MLAVRKDDDGRWWQACQRGDEFMWGTPRTTSAELEAAHETDEARAAALTAVVAVKKEEPTCPLRLALREWQTSAGLKSKRVSALLRCSPQQLSEWQNRLSSETVDARISLAVKELVQRSLCDAEVAESIQAQAAASAVEKGTAEKGTGCSRAR